MLGVERGIRPISHRTVLSVVTLIDSLTALTCCIERDITVTMLSWGQCMSLAVLIKMKHVLYCN